MSKIIWVCSKKGFEQQTEEKLKSICSFISPDNIIPNAPIITVNSQVAYGIINPKNNIKYHGNSVSLGVIYGDDNDWHVPLKIVPDGSYAIFRECKEYCEVISDAAGSRTIWYYHNDHHLIAATSQFAIVKYLEDFKFNQQIIPWMLTTGTLGPDFSWDKRIKKLPPDSSLILIKESWNISINSNPLEFNSKEESKSNLELNLIESLTKTFQSIKMDFSQWLLPLSGGYDSRGILYLMKRNKLNPIKTITWGLTDSQKDQKSDSFVAKKLAKNLDVEHHFHSTNFSQEPIETIFERFIINGEGRIDHISGYLDGFQIWKSIHEQGMQGVIRGDENFGWLHVNTETDVLNSIGIDFFYEYKNLEKIIKPLGISQNLPKYLTRKKTESLPQWRDRLYHQYRLQTIISALSDLKFGYIEQIMPLLSRKVIQTVKNQPDKVRSEKFLWKKIVKDFKPKIEFASEQSIANIQNILTSEDFVNYFKSQLNKKSGNEIFDQNFLEEISNGLKQDKKDLSHTEKLTLKKFLKNLIPSKLYSIAKEKLRIKKNLDFNVLAMRVTIILLTYRFLKNN